jgi:C-terminal processing protease CtpA/Prc
VPKPTFSWAGNTLVRWGVIDGTRIGYVYVWGWFGSAPEDFAAAVTELTQTQRVDALILDFRFNIGGFVRGPLSGLAALFDHPSATFGMDERLDPGDHLKMRSLRTPSEFRVDFDRAGRRDKVSFNGPIAVLVGPGALSAGDFAAIWAGFHPNVRLFGKSTAMAAGLPTQASLGTELNLHPQWSATIAEANTYLVGAPQDYLIHTDLAVDQRVWFRPEDVAIGKDSVVEAARQWIGQ